MMLGHKLDDDANFDVLLPTVEEKVEFAERMKTVASSANDRDRWGGVEVVAIVARITGRPVVVFSPCKIMGVHAYQWGGGGKTGEGKPLVHPAAPPGNAICVFYVGDNHFLSARLADWQQYIVPNLAPYVC